MGPEINIDSVLALEKQIEEGTGDVTHLKRARNSLLNISIRVPPEILGHIFRWNVTPIGDFGGLRKGSYNFLLVCHHWFKISSSTPALWTFWGDTLKQWSQQYRRSGIAPIDLRLNTHHNMYEGVDVPFDGPLRDALRDRAACDSIRSVHLQGLDTSLLHSVVSSLITDGEDIRDSSIESLILGYSSLDISHFLARYRFPKLRDLRLSLRSNIPCWDQLKLQATSLTTLSLGLAGSIANSTPTTFQLLSILTSHPNLKNLSLYLGTIPHDVGDGSILRVPLRHLKELRLEGNYCHTIRLLDRLEYPDILDHVGLKLIEDVEEGILEFLGPYLRDRIRCDDRFRNRLGIRTSFTPGTISFAVSAVGELNTPTMVPRYCHPCLSFELLFSNSPFPGAMEELCINLVALTPRERVVHFVAGELAMYDVRELPTTMPNIEHLSLKRPVITDEFLRPGPLSDQKLLLSLRHLSLDYPILPNHDDWRPLISYLTHQTSGGQAISLRLCVGRHRPPVPPEVVREIENLVEEFDLIQLV